MPSADAVTLPVVRLPHAAELQLPSYATEGAAGLDLRAAVTDPLTLAPGARALVPTGLILHIPDGFEGQIRARSGLAYKHGVTVLNGPGTIDSDYRGEVKVLLVNLGAEPFTVARGDRVAQLVLARYAQASLVVLDPQDDTTQKTARGAGGFGSTGLG
ncbi:dUTP diphosphatase [Myxococcota bacterium]|nr:dUTP diphosphatase [Myxococcota bacterium]